MTMTRTLCIALIMLASPLTAFAATSLDDAEKAWRTHQFSRAVTIYKGLASRGDVEAHYRLGNAYSNGKGIRKDLGAASRHYLRAARQGHGPAAFNLALALERGHGVKVNMRGALYWYRFAANADHRLAVCKLLALGFETHGAHCPAAYADAAERHRSLRRAVEKGDARRIRTLLSKGADPNLLTAAGKPVLYRAVERNHATSVRTLLEHGADPDATTTQGATPLYAAIRAHHATIAKLLLAHDAKVDVIVRGGTTPLGLAASRGDFAATRLLLAAGADTELRGADGRRPSDHALSRGHTRIAQLLRATRRQQLRAVDLELPLLSVAAARGSISVVREQIGLGTDINGRDPDGMTPLMRASEAGQDDVVKLLLELRARVTTTGPKGITALQLAAKRGHLQSVRLISRARPTPKDMDTAMNLAVNTRHWKVVDHLLAARPRNTPPKITLTRAVADQAPHRLIENLISRGVDINGVDDQGATPLGTALKKGDAELTALLLRNGANPKRKSTGIPPICIAAVEGSPRTIELLLVSGADVNQPTEQGATALLVAAANGHSKTIDILLHWDADLEEQDPRGQTALMLASAGGHTFTVKELIKRGASASRRNTRGQSAATLAALNGHGEVVALLGVEGARP